ncbi:MAG: S1 RNA-binding domain-containing protein [Clostridia bacterium]|nr:S1 RNA-binding domain-containing protein [Clostridia bacterium]
MQVEEGKILTGRITGITNFGAFVDLGDGVTGLVHISEISTAYVKDINDHVKVGEVIEVKVLAPDKKGKIGLSIKQVMQEKNKGEDVPKPKFEKKSRVPKLPETDLHAQPADFDWFKPKNEELSFDDMLNKFKQASDEKMHDIKRNMESKRGSGRSKSNSY